MAAQTYYPPFIPAFSSNGAPVPGALLNFYVSGTTMRSPVYANDAMTVELPNPVQADAAGKYPNIYLDETVTYRVVQTDADGAQIGDAIDPYVPGQALKGEKGERGSQGYSAGTLADLKAAPTADSPLNYDGAVWTFTPGNYTGKADDMIVVESDTVPLTNGAWVRQEAQSITYARPAAPAQSAARYLERVVINLADYGGVGDNSTANDAALAAILSQYGTATTDGRIPGIDIKLQRSGIHRFQNPIPVDNVNVRLMGEDSEIRYAGASHFVDVGNANYLTDLGAGYYRFELHGTVVRVTNAGCPAALRNRGYRSFYVVDSRILGGVVGIETEGCYGGGGLTRVVLQQQSSRGVDLRQRNNLFRMLEVKALGIGGGTGVGYYLSTTGAEAQGIIFDTCDAEGCLTGYQFAGTDIGAIQMRNCWAESNTTSIFVQNENATLKNGFVILGGQFDADIIIGDTAMTGLLRGFHIGGGAKMTNGFIRVNVDSGVTIGDVALTGTADVVYATPSGASGPQPLPAAGRSPVAQVMPRYKPGHGVPAMSSDPRGSAGDIRYDGGHLFVRSGDGAWRRIQSGRFADGGMATIGNGTPNVAGYRTAMVGQAGAGSITKLVGGVPGQMVTLVGGYGVAVTIAANSDIKLPGNANVVLEDNDVLSLICFAPDRFAAANPKVDNPA